MSGPAIPSDLKARLLGTIPNRHFRSVRVVGAVFTVGGAKAELSLGWGGRGRNESRAANEGGARLGYVGPKWGLRTETTVGRQQRQKQTR